MKKILWIFLMVLFLGNKVICHAKENEDEVGLLYSKSAVLMDGESGRVLYEKNGEEFLANASTTKILTCILALENCSESDIVTVSSYAASMPAVKLYLKEGEQYILGDLLYSLMLESHNDTAVAIAEHVAGSCDNFSRLMNEKAEEIGCTNSFFLTPNGLDATQKSVTGDGRELVREHGTSAKDLALIMRYCIMLSERKEDFLRITSTPYHSFGDVEQKRSFTCRNHNSFLNMMEGALSGKTGFTARAGYCYVGALRREGKTYVVALLACGWPGNRTYKWQDCKKLMEYGLEQYELFPMETLEKSLQKELWEPVENAKSEKIGQEKVIELGMERKNIRSVLLKEGEKVTVKLQKKKLSAPVEKWQQAGKIIYYIQNEKWLEENLYCKSKAEKIDIRWCFFKVMEKALK